MRYRRYCLIMILVFLVPLLSAPALATEEEGGIKKITREEARTLVYDKGVTIIDVRYDKGWEKSAQKITGAVREDPNEIGSWVDKYPRDKMIILYCD